MGMRGHLKGTFAVEIGEGGFKQTWGTCAKPICTFALLKKNCLIFQTASRVLSDKLPGSSSLLSPVHRMKMVFLSKRRVYCHCLYNCAFINIALLC